MELADTFLVSGAAPRLFERSEYSNGFRWEVVRMNARQSSSREAWKGSRAWGIGGAGQLGGVGYSLRNVLLAY